jgi:5-methylcytosine-specific restriction protein A
MVLAEEPLCRKCLESGQVAAAIDVDHIIPLRRRPDLRLDRSNLQSLCKSHHSQKTLLESAT